MRKTLIALILVLPMVFVLVVFSSVNLVSLGVNISVNGITIRAEDTDEEGTLLVNMAEKDQHYITAEVSPSNATETGYTLTSSDPAVADVAEDGRLVPHREGTVEITAKSNDKSFTDSMTVVVVSSLPYDFGFTLSGENGDIALTETEEGYAADVPAGTYHYNVAIEPVGFSEYSVDVTSEGHAEVEKGARSIFLPFSGRSEMEICVKDGVDGDIRKKVELNVGKPADGDVVINGETNLSGIQLVEGTKNTQLYVECNGNFSDFICERAHLSGQPANLKNGRYILDVVIDDDVTEAFEARLIAGGKTVNLLFSFTEFDFSVLSDLPVTERQEGGQGVTMLTGNAVNFYAVSSGVKDVVYTWDFSGPADYFTEDGSTATVRAVNGGEYVLTVTASYGGENGTTVEKVLHLSVVNKVSAVQIANNVKADLAASYTVAGREYNASLELKDDYVYPLRVYSYSTSGMGKAGDDVGYRVDDESVAIVEERNGSLVLVPRGTGKVTVTAYWKGNESFSANISATLSVNVVKDAVAVRNAPELVKATEAGLKVVLLENIKLGTDAAGNVLSPDVREAMLGRMRSTYNLEWYTQASADSKESIKPEDFDVSYVLEFKNDVYGNGKSIDADNFTHAVDGSGKPLLERFRGPRYFVKYKQMASVAGQDNIAFLIRTAGVKLYGVNLLGCSDSSLANENGEYDLTNLNLTGTTLEVNADAEILNCRIRNGRNVVRVYGGNREGNSYFIDDLSQNRGCDEERIEVKIEGCILSQGREFILKMGANRALRASLSGGAEPALTDQSGKPYPESGKSNCYGDLFEDPYFYRTYVMTDVTLKDSVIETSGLFTVGIESNFAGSYLYPGSPHDTYYDLTEHWRRSGGTSFASVLRLEGDVRLYDWKDLSLVDSSTLIESPMDSLSEWLKLDIGKMLDLVSANHPDLYGGVIEEIDAKRFVHGGIALYGGGRNYSSVDMRDLSGELADFMHVTINISVLSEGDDPSLQRQGSILPRAAGTHDFNFYMYGASSANDYAKQRSDEQNGKKYDGVSPLPLF